MAGVSNGQMKDSKSGDDDERVNFLLDQLSGTTRIDINNESHLTDVINWFRYLRNRFGDQNAGPSFWHALINRASDLCSLVEHLIVDTDSTHSQSVLLLGRVAIQFLGNAVSRRETADVFRSQIWRNGKGVIFLITLFGHTDRKLRIFGSMVLYNCLRDQLITMEIGKREDIVEKVLELVSEQNEESDGVWCRWIVWKLLAHVETFLENGWSRLNSNYRIMLVRLAHAMDSDSSEFHINDENAIFIGTIFVHETARVIEIQAVVDKREFELLDSLVNFLCEFTASQEHRGCIRDDQRILDAALTLLKFTAKPETNQRTELEKLAGQTNSANDDSMDKRYPANLRARLVRLLANVCYQHPENQKWIREREGIALIMDCTRLDAVNPFITESAIFALRNILERCPENQRVVASMTPIGFRSEEDRLLFEMDRGK